MKVKFVILLVAAVTMQLGVATESTPTRMTFAKELFRAIAGDRSQENIVFSPVSIESALTLAYMGAEGQTGEQMRSGLQLSSTDKNHIAQEYSDFMKTEFNKASSEGPVLKMANRIYVNAGLEIAPEFQTLAEKYFQSSAEQVNFADSPGAVNKINAWVEDNTNHKIKQLLQPSSVTSETSSILVNAIYFKGLWQAPFNAASTHKRDFYVNPNEAVPVDMMYKDARFNYAVVPELDATVLEMPYKDSDMSMYFLLPNKRDGLQEMEKKFASINLHELPPRMKSQKIEVFLPKFRVEFDIDLKETLEKLGMTTMFTDAADFSKLFTNAGPQKVGAVKHKAYLDVNEAGSEAAAATFLQTIPTSAVLDPVIFNANHPFMFAIRNDKGVYFAGHVKRI